MSQQFLDMLTAYSETKDISVFERLPVSTQASIESWYQKYVPTKTFSKRRALDLMLFLFCRQDLDLWVDSEFRAVCDYVCENFYVPKDQFLEMFIEYKAMLGARTDGIV